MCDPLWPWLLHVPLWLGALALCWWAMHSTVRHPWTLWRLLRQH